MGLNSLDNEKRLLFNLNFQSSKPYKTVRSFWSLFLEIFYKWFVHLIFSSIGFWYLDHLLCDFLSIFFPVFSVLPILPCKMQTRIIFLNLHNFVDKSDQKPKMKTKGCLNMFCKLHNFPP